MLEAYSCKLCGFEEVPEYFDHAKILEGQVKPETMERFIKENGAGKWLINGNQNEQICLGCIEVEEKERKNKAMLWDIYRQSEMPKILKRKNFNEFKSISDMQRNLIVNLTEQELKKGLFLSGRSGCGKTHLVSAYCNQEARKGQWFKFFTEPDLYDTLYRFPQELQNIRNVTILVIDDIGSAFLGGGGYRLEKLYQVIDYRYTSELMTFFTSNLSPAKLNNKWDSIVDGYGDKLMSRIGELTEMILMGEIEDWRVKYE